MSNTLLRVENLSISHRETLLVKNASFTLEKSKTLCIVGESGSGKTLSALAVLGLLPDALNVSSGEIYFNGKNMRTFSHEQLRQMRGAQIGMIFQEPLTSLNPVFKAGDQIEEVFKIHTDMSPQARYRKTLELLEKVQIDDPERRYHAYPSQLSGGQRQRIMIAMALAMSPKLLIADEPTTALDVTVQSEILHLMKELQKEFETALLFITHDFGVVDKMADDVVVMEKGRLVEQGPVKSIMKKPQQPYTQKLLAAMPRLQTKFPGQPKTTDKNFLQVDDLSKVFQIKKRGIFSKSEPFHALKNISFHMNKGETLGIVGESGCGKSTLARCLIRLYEPDNGTISFQGEEVTTLKNRQLKHMRRHMQMVFQDPFSSLNPRMRIGETVSEGLRAHHLMNKKERAAHARELLNDCGLPADSYQRYPHQFSGGQRQRIGIARALALKPALIIADEPVSSLDVSVQKQILDLLQTLKEKHNLSYLFISHDLRVISQICDRVLVMHKGEIVEQGPAKQIFTKPEHSYTQELLTAVPSL